jgi:actin related protein 2/3 complex subunit 3
VLIYIILFISECLTKIASQIKGNSAPSLSEAGKLLTTLALTNFAIPGDTDFPLNVVYDKPKDRSESDQMRTYMSQLRQETASRLLEVIYSPNYSDTEGGKRPTKWWMSFQKRKFMNKSL